MAKDPAFLFYPNDWSGGTTIMNRLQRGGYLDLLLYQFQNREFSLDEAKIILGADFDTVWSVCERKFEKSQKGMYFNKKMREIILKRAAFTESRRENRKGKTKASSEIDKNNTSKTLDKQVGNGNTVLNINKDSEDFLRSLHHLKEKFDNDYKIDEKVIAVNGFNPAQLMQARLEFWSIKELDDEMLGKDYKDLQTHFLRWCGMNKERIKRQVQDADDFEGGGIDDNDLIKKRWEELSKRKNA